MEPLESVTKSVYIWDISGQSDKISAPTGSKGYLMNLPHSEPSSHTTRYQPRHRNVFEHLMESHSMYFYFTQETGISIF